MSPYVLSHVTSSKEVDKGVKYPFRESRKVKAIKEEITVASMTENCTTATRLTKVGLIAIILFLDR
jgi:hypothetical protein